MLQHLLVIQGSEHAVRFGWLRLPRRAQLRLRRQRGTVAGTSGVVANAGGGRDARPGVRKGVLTPAQKGRQELDLFAESLGIVAEGGGGGGGSGG